MLKHPGRIDAIEVAFPCDREAMQGTLRQLWLLYLYTLC